VINDKTKKLDEGKMENKISCSSHKGDEMTGEQNEGNKLQESGKKEITGE
jgi:hypothetical protein